MYIYVYMLLLLLYVPSDVVFVVGPPLDSGHREESWHSEHLSGPTQLDVMNLNNTTTSAQGEEVDTD